MSIARMMLAVALANFCSFSLAADRLESGEVPKSADGRKLNLDFERGTLANWTAQGKAFEGQPIKGDSVSARGRGMKSQHAGQFWIGGFERSLSDEPTGSLASEPFVVTRPWASFLIAGGSSHDTRVELVRRDTGEVIAERSGDNTETLKPAVVDLQKVVGKEIFIRLVDNSRGGWGHVNFDDFRLHSTRPELPDQAAEQPDDYPFAGLDPEAAAKAMVVPEGFRVTLQAGEPEVKQPIAMAFDDRGRLWVAEAYTYPIRAAEGKGQDRILIFEDTDGDDRFDRRTVFMENLNLV
ncbi:MAG TPA: dehydrogenase, partial [Pirellulales bacterium]